MILEYFFPSFGKYVIYRNYFATTFLISWIIEIMSLTFRLKLTLKYGVSSMTDDRNII